MDLVVVGSIPTRHPGCKSSSCTFFVYGNFALNSAPVAHLDRATDFESVGRRFESSQTQTKSLLQNSGIFIITGVFFMISVNCV